MPTDYTEEWGDKLAELVAQQVVTPPPAENAVNARVTGIDDTGIAALVSKLTKDPKPYGGFALVFQHDKDYESCEWLQFITRQLVIDDVATKGNLINKGNEVSYQLVDLAEEITDYALATGSKPANWNTCWKVDAGVLNPFYRNTYEFAISHEKKLTAILDAPSPFVGKPKPRESLRDSYKDLPDDLVVMKDQLGSRVGISRAYFSDYLVKKDDDKWHILARFDFNVTWDPAVKDTKKDDFTIHSFKATATKELLECHKTALLHETTEKKTPWKSFYDSILL